MGFEFEIAPNWALADGIEAVRNILKHLWLDAGECARVLECLVNYSFGYDDKNRSFKTVPKHDWTSHCVDQIRMLAVTWDRTRVLEQPLLFDSGNGNGRRRGDRWY